MIEFYSPKRTSWCLAMVASLFALGCAANEQATLAAKTSIDLLITNALIVDGTGSPAYEGSIAIGGGKVVAVGALNEAATNAARTINAEGRVVAPGFIDMHTHGDPIEDSLEGYLAMGVTTITVGQDGRSIGVPAASRGKYSGNVIADWMASAEEKGLQLNVVPFSGHATLRFQSGIGDKNTALSATEIQQLQAQLQADLELGVFGLSTGLEYTPGIHATFEELKALAQTAGACDAIVMSHMRTEDDDRIEEEGIAELVALGEYARVHISHLKIVYGKGRERAEDLLAYIEAAKLGVEQLTADIYPYVAGYTGVAILFPEWALPPADYADIVRTRSAELASYLEARVTKRNGPDALLFGTEPYRGMTLKQAADKAGLTAVEFLMEIGPDGGSGAHFTQDNSTHDVLVASALTAISTDGGPGMPHPRSTGTYAKLIEHYVNDTGMLSLEGAIYKATGLPASILNLNGRGVITQGAYADLVIFDPNNVKANSNYLTPGTFASGFDMVIVNGEIIREDGQLRPVRQGQVLKHQCWSERK